MKKLSFIITNFVMFSTMLLAQNTEKDLSSKVQDITWINGTSIDLGSITKDKPESVTFEFLNTSNVPVIITSAKGQCGCTSVEFSRKAILTNKKGFVKTTFNAASVGVFNKTVSVTTNKGETIQLTLKGDVK